MSRRTDSSAAASMRQLPLPISGTVPHCFENFVAGPNGPALDQLLELARLHESGHGAPPVYLWGPVGCGKTHLLQSFAQRLRAQGGEVGSFDPATPLPWPLDEQRNLTILDDCDGFDAERQQAAFALFVDASARGAMVAAAGRVPPVDLPLRDDLRSRLGWGHVLALQPLADAEIRSLLAGEARRRGLELADGVAAYILSHYSRDLKSLMRLLDRADHYALSRQRALTVPLLRELDDEAQPQEGPR